jgi:hypothetical protein
LNLTRAALGMPLDSVKADRALGLPNCAGPNSVRVTGPLWRVRFRNPNLPHG